MKKMSHNTAKYVVVAGWAVLLLALVTSQPVSTYLEVLKSGSNPVEVTATIQNPDLEKIEEWKTKLDEAPQDAYIDPVWKAVPGYNGRVVDVKASLEMMQKTGKYEESGIVFKEQLPKVHLNQLGAYPIYRGNPKKEAVSFMVNVAWGNEYLDQILDTLDRHKVKTTFFLDGSWVRRNPELANKIKDRGHELGNHAYSHPDMSKLGEERIRQEIGKTQAIIEKTTGVTPTWFAPPSGSFSQRVVEIAQDDFKMKTILWTADTIDWKNPPVEQMVERVRKKLDNGVLILMHPTTSSAQGLDQMLKLAKEKGLTPTTVTEVLSSSRLP
ncbi:polysaccharide deacetylase family protein [Brevibacillus daliensis]|uniref:polysaccharide deacetylase family protein n=1 Tax=Brevibacillus daliensis TaxID=2892995 RepID=UPI001E35CCE0|nr:polysaccharide deacetylase family protein [Brevibacillus daliensis]